MAAKRFVRVALRFPVYNPRHTYVEAKVVEGVRESEWQGRRYLWPRTREVRAAQVSREGVELVAPEGALVWVKYWSGSSKKYYYVFEALIRVREGARETDKLVNTITREQEEVTLGNAVVVRDLAFVEYDATLATLYTGEGYELSRSRARDNLVAYAALQAFRAEEAQQPPEEEETEEKEKEEEGEQYWVIAWDVPTSDDARRRRFYRRLQKLLSEYVQNHVTLREAAERLPQVIWAQQSVIITNDAGLAREIHRLAQEHAARVLLGRISELDITG